MYIQVVKLNNSSLVAAVRKSWQYKMFKVNNKHIN